MKHVIKIIECICLTVFCCFAMYCCTRLSLSHESSPQSATQPSKP